MPQTDNQTPVLVFSTCRTHMHVKTRIRCDAEACELVNRWIDLTGLPGSEIVSKMIKFADQYARMEE